jgi:hypothetical protein
VSSEDEESSELPGASKTIENVEKIREIIMKIVAEQSMSSQTPFGSVMKFARRSKQKI